MPDLPVTLAFRRQDGRIQREEEEACSIQLDKGTIVIPEPLGLPSFTGVILLHKPQKTALISLKSQDLLL